jgi:hypothetical protein
MNDLVERLRAQLASDHIRGCMGRQYHCDCGYDIKTEGLLQTAADRIEALEAALRQIANDADYYGQRATMYKKVAQAALLGARPAPEIGSEILLSGDFEITQEGKKP